MNVKGMGSDASWKVGRSRENFTIITKDFQKSSIVLKKVGGMLIAPHHSPEALKGMDSASTSSSIIGIALSAIGKMT